MRCLSASCRSRLGLRRHELSPERKDVALGFGIDNAVTLRIDNQERGLIVVVNLSECLIDHLQASAELPPAGKARMAKHVGEPVGPRAFAPEFEEDDL